MQISRNKSFYISKESNPYNTGLGQQHGRRFIVLYTSVTSVAVVVLFHPWFKFHLSLLWGMVLYDKEFKSRHEFFGNDLLNHLSFSRNNFWKWYSTRHE